MFLCPCIRLALFISNLCDIMAVNIEGHDVIFFHFPYNESYNLILKQIHLFAHFLQYVL